ncbi:hypothetical protein C9374_011404 [Naegleria lovaniensis]|uniref:Protein tyrosine phosphatase n=1 Tax=Naegleria lovaniensis TaxID=51637 RepID=A0AA88KRH9_NAELO|nr:uncharacterized protein C9374_011404 [Naegleria lovaniensis]KAG2392679.1 hypothetical protein C9374_011404 [Naegleria lovaniensis]
MKHKQQYMGSSVSSKTSSSDGSVPNTLLETSTTNEEENVEHHHVISMDPTTVLKIKESVLRHAKHYSHREFSELRNFEKSLEPVDFTSALKHPNKNRYGNVLANECTRVILENDPEYYVNANNIQIGNEILYIAGQGPLPQTIYDFWRMIIEKNVSVILMLSNVIEQSRPKCAQYWPDTTEIHKQTDMNQKEQRDILIQNNKEEFVGNEDIIHRFLNVQFQGDQVHRVNLIHFTAWPDFGVPDLTSFQHVVQHVNNVNSPKGSPIFVHCSAGIGRTGTFCLVDSILKDFYKTYALNPTQIMERAMSLKKQRYGMIQTAEQYDFAYRSIATIIGSLAQQ